MRARTVGLLLSALILPAAFMIEGCSDEQGSDGGPSTAPPDPSGFFVERAAEVGLDFVHHHGGAGRKLLVETNSAGVAILDYDGDGVLDLIFAQGAALPGFRGEADFRDRLYRNEGGLRFADVTDEAGASEEGYTYHIAAPDVDGDGDPDLYFSNYAENHFRRNDGGRFEDASAEWGANSTRWSAAAAFGDFDRDGDLDLYVANYCDYPLQHPGCGPIARGEEWRSYCAPDEFPGAMDQLYQNDEGHYVDVSAASGIEPADGSALGVVCSDLDDDGDLDIFVANDGRPNFLWSNAGGLRFVDRAWEACVAVGGHGVSEACMGTDVADVDRDGDFDLIVTNLAVETNTLYANRGNAVFSDKSTSSGIALPSKRWVGFGCEFLDIDNDTDVDVLVANGHVIDNISMFEPSQTYRQPPQVYVNDGAGRFKERGREYGTYFSGQYVGRGLAVGDLDDDGDLDVVIAHNNAAAVLLENRKGNEKAWVGFELRGKAPNTGAIGAKLTVVSAGVTQIEEVRGTSSYAAFHDLRLHFGLGDQIRVDSVTIRWPTGAVQVLTDVEAGKYHQVEEPE